MEKTTQQSQSPSKHSDPKKYSDNSFLKFTGLAFELLGILIVGIGSGYGLDVFLETPFPYITVIFSILSLIGMIYYLMNKLPR